MRAEEIVSNLREQGYARIDSTFLLGDGEGRCGLNVFEVMCRGQIPVDPYNATGLFNRRYGRAVYLAWNEHVSYFPDEAIAASDQLVACYQQPAMFNPDHEGRKRWFPALLPAMRNSAFLTAVIKRCGSILPQDWQAWHVGIHLQQMVATANGSGLPSPNYVHRDGEPFTFAFLVDRKNVVGGENVIAALDAAEKELSNLRSDEIMARFTLEESWSGWVVDDRLVSHAVGPVALSDPSVKMGHRTALVIDYTPLTPNYLQK